MSAPLSEIVPTHLPRSRFAQRPRVVAADPLIRTKLYRPALTGDHVTRARVLELMDRSLAVPLTVVSAPAGYGKSTLVSEWLALQKCRSAWLSLEAAESELGTFLNYLLAAVETISAGACSQTRALLAAPELPSAATLAAYLVNDLDRIDEPFLLVLDDYHSLRRASAVHGVVEAMLEHAPRALHLILISRNELPWSMTSLRAKGRVSEPWFRELCFTTGEATEFLAAAGCTIDHGVVDKLDAQIEGWPVGWRLLLQALRRSSDSATVLEELTGTLPDIQAYLVGEVLERQAPEVREYLLRTAILDRFCPELVDAICRPDGELSGDLDGRRFMDLLQREGLFGIALDPLNKWLRYHHVFQELLRAELAKRWPASEIEVLHRRASRWLEQHGFIESAIRHALAGASSVDAAKIVERHRHEELDRERWRTLETWLDLIPADVKKERLESLLCVAWVVHFSGRRDVLRLIVREIDSRLAHENLSGSVLAEVHLVKGLAAYWAGDGNESQRRFEKVAELSPRGEELCGCVAQVYLGLARHRNGDGDLARESLRLQILAKPANVRYLGRLLVAKAFLHLLSADAQPVLALARQAEEVAAQAQNNFVTTWGVYLQGAAAFQMQRLPEAKDSFLRAVANRHLIEKRAAVDAMAGLALTHQFLGEPAAAAAVAADLAEFIRGADDNESAMLAESIRARLALLQGDLDAAVRWARGVALELQPLRFVFWIEMALITRIRIQIAEGTTASLRAAITTLRDLRPQLDAAHFAGHTIEVMVLEALALDKLGEKRAARHLLQQAVSLAAPGAWVRPFVEAPIGALLEGLPASAEHSEFVAHIAAGRRELAAVERCTPRMAPLVAVSRQNVSRAELTNRELDILELAAQRLQSKEIAARLHISDYTVKDHLKHIYYKLGVGKRSEAVAVALAAGILE